MVYRPRIVDGVLTSKLRNYCAVFIKGPRACGKTRTALQFAKSRSYNLQNPRDYALIKNMIESESSSYLDSLFEEPNPILIDEWQEDTRIWNMISTELVKRNEPRGMFILTGSVAVKPNKSLDSAMGYIVDVNMWTMSLYESADSTGDISLSELMKNPDCFKAGCQSNLKKDDLLRVICRGGWPGCLDLNERDQLVYAKDMMETIFSRELHLFDGAPQNRDITYSIFFSYAKNNCKQTSQKKIYGDVESTENMNLVDEYIDALKELYIIEDINRWAARPGATSNKVLQKHVMVEPSLAVAALGENYNSLEKDSNKFLRGILFECLCVRDIKIYAAAQKTNVNYSFYRGENSEEIDIVLRDCVGNMALIECKLAKGDIDLAASNLIKVEKRIYEEEDKEIYGKDVPPDVHHDYILT